MKTLNVLTSACRYCHYYKPEGRRGGVCQQLGVPVQGSWKACALAVPQFAPSWEGLQGIMIEERAGSREQGAGKYTKTWVEIKDSELGVLCTHSRP